MSMGNPVEIKPQVIRDGDDVDWVARRQLCSGGGRGAFDAIAARIRTDVERANNALDQTPLELQTSGDRDLQVVKAQAPDRIEVASFMLYPDGMTRVEVSMRRRRWPDIFEVAHEWDEATASCRFTIDGDDVQLWQISERALLPLVFPDALSP